MKNTPLSEKLILYFVLLGLGAILIISTVSFYSTKRALMSRTFDQLNFLTLILLLRAIIMVIFSVYLCKNRYMKYRLM